MLVSGEAAAAALNRVERFDSAGLEGGFGHETPRRSLCAMHHIGDHDKTTTYVTVCIVAASSSQESPVLYAHVFLFANAYRNKRRL